MSTDVNECLNSPCKNAGTCIDSPGSYTCRCAGGWTGTNCTMGKSSVSIATHLLFIVYMFVQNTFDL